MYLLRTRRLAKLLTTAELKTETDIIQLEVHVSAETTTKTSSSPILCIEQFNKQNDHYYINHPTTQPFPSETPIRLIYVQYLIDLLLFVTAEYQVQRVCIALTKCHK